MIGRLLAWLADRILPVPPHVMVNDWFADVEADHDAWEPDELWFAAREEREFDRLMAEFRAEINEILKPPN